MGKKLSSYQFSCPRGPQIHHFSLLEWQAVFKEKEEILPSILVYSSLVNGRSFSFQKIVEWVPSEFLQNKTRKTPDHVIAGIIL